MPRRDAGFTLVELMIALVLLLIVGGVLYTVLTGQQRATRAQAERVSMYSAMRNGTQLLPDELREINIPSAGAVNLDLTAISASSITYRAMHGMGFVCQVAPTELRVLNIIMQDSVRWLGWRPPEAGRDSLLVFADRDPNVSTDDVWIRARLTGVTSSTCAGRPALALAVQLDTVTGFTPMVRTTEIAEGAPVRAFESMRFSTGSQDGRQWLMASSLSAGDAPTPVIGPLAANGVTFRYLDAAGAVTADPTQVRSIGLTLRGQTDQAVTSTQSPTVATFVQDSVTTSVSLRNVPRN